MYSQESLSRQIKLIKVGNSISMSFPNEVLDRLGIKDGDTLELIDSNWDTTRRYVLINFYLIAQSDMI
jgi:antitoxin component of MazEF toxin-antitoxin module